jgi:hypothetical protein
MSLAAPKDCDSPQPTAVCARQGLRNAALFTFLSANNAEGGQRCSTNGHRSPLWRQSSVSWSAATRAGSWRVLSPSLRDQPPMLGHSGLSPWGWGQSSSRWRLGMPSSFPGCSNTVTWSHVATTGRKVVRPHPTHPQSPGSGPGRHRQASNWGFTIYF